MPNLTGEKEEEYETRTAIGEEEVIGREKRGID